MSKSVAPNSKDEGRTAFVAGGTSGINLEIAATLAENGVRVGLLSRNPEKVAAAVAHIEARGGIAMGTSADVRDFDAVQAGVDATVAKFGPLDIVVSGAAGNFVAPAAKMSANAFKSVIDIDLLGTFNVVRACYDHLKKPGASIINISAPQSKFPYHMQSHVSSAKAGIDLLTKSLALEWGSEGVRVNAISPGPIEDTEGMDRLASTPETRAMIESSIPLGRFGKKTEIAALALFLCSDAAGYITGAIIPCDGGQLVCGSGGQVPG